MEGKRRYLLRRYRRIDKQGSWRLVVLLLPHQSGPYLCHLLKCCRKNTTQCKNLGTCRKEAWLCHTLAAQPWQLRSLHVFQTCFGPLPVGTTQEVFLVDGSIAYLSNLLRKRYVKQRRDGGSRWHYPGAAPGNWGRDSRGHNVAQG
jgi:hypothetical protein